MPLPEQIRLELDAMEAAVHGEPVDPEYAELAELALLLAAAAPEVPAAAAERLDARFAALEPQPAGAWRAAKPTRGLYTGQRRPWFLRPAYGAGLAVAGVLAVLVIVLGPGGGSGSSTFSSNSAPVVGVSRSAGSSASGASASGSSSGVSSSSASGAVSSSGSSSDLSVPTAASAPASSSKAAGVPNVNIAVPTPDSNGRRIVQSAQLTLSAPSARIATVAQELFDAVGAEQGIVKHSQVSSGSDGYASFTLSIPTGNLTATLTRLSQLRYARVASSSASTSDVNSQYLDDQRALADAKALRVSLLKQLEEATTTSAIDSLKAQIRTAEATIAADESKLNRLQARISYSSVSVQINPGSGPVHPLAGGGGFSLRKAGHDALAVLVVAAGVILIALAVLVPLGLLVGLGAWLSAGWRRRGRERALDAAG